MLIPINETKLVRVTFTMKKTCPPMKLNPLQAEYIKYLNVYHGVNILKPIWTYEVQLRGSFASILKSYRDFKIRSFESSLMYLHMYPTI